MTDGELMGEIRVFCTRGFRIEVSFREVYGHWEIAALWKNERVTVENVDLRAGWDELKHQIAKAVVEGRIV